MHQNKWKWIKSDQNRKNPVTQNVLNESTNQNRKNPVTQNVLNESKSIKYTKMNYQNEWKWIKITQNSHPNEANWIKINQKGEYQLNKMIWNEPKSTAIHHNYSKWNILSQNESIR